MLNSLSYPRSDRVSELIHKEIAQLLIHGVKDPRVRDVSISRVVMSRDLKTAKIFFSLLIGGEDRVKEALTGLNSARGFIRSILKKRLALKYIPQLTMIVDRSVDYSIHISQVLDGLDYETEPDDEE